MALKGAVIQTKVIQVTVIDEDGKSKSFNLDNPKQNLTFNQIRQALQPAIQGRWWINTTGSPVIGLKSANYTETTKTYVDGGEVSVTPSSLYFDDENQLDKTLTVSGAEIDDATGSSITATMDGTPISKDQLQFLLTITNENIRVQLVQEGITGTGQIVGNGQIYISAAGTTITIPVTINMQWT